MRKLFTFATCTLLFLLCLCVVSANVETVSTSIELTSGCSCTRNITVNNTFNKDLKVHISTEIFPDGEGITVTYYPLSPFVLNKKSNITIEMTIDADVMLMPQQYVIETSFSYEDYSYKTSKYLPSSATITEDEGTDNETVVPEDEVNDAEDDVFVADVVIGSNDGYTWLMYLPVIVGVIVVSLLFYFRKNKEDEKENERYK